ncbi:hypothetical protein SETIT_1G298700v2 [Setaria italica]|uniref:Tyrosine--tRNA ligase n=1 Tax=Setaria italica TaxID=4555 RepID=A0A368PQN3_SETIT|nr:hypothetical protein SETIT_1G298700v2 [Setaria italica]
MLARAFGVVGKAWKRTRHISIQASISPRRCSHMSPQLCHLHSRLAQPENFPEEQNALQNNSGGAPPMLNYIYEQNRSKQPDNGNLENSAVAAVDSIRDAVEGSFDQRFATLKSIGEDRVNDRELELLLKKKPAPICYVWCDPSPWMHISEGIIKTLCVNKMVKSGCKVKIVMADWFARMNPYIGGSLNKMRAIGLYNIEVWKAAGMALDSVELVWLSDEINQHANVYWPLAMDVSRRTTLRRIKGFYGSRHPAVQPFTAADVFYPSLQCATILFQKVDIWLLGMGQHEANLLAREYCKRVKRRNKPIALSHNILPNLLQYPEEEHRRNSLLAIYMEDNECKENHLGSGRRVTIVHFSTYGLCKSNPCLEYIKYIILPWHGKFEVVRKKEDGGDKTFLSMEELTNDYASGALQPGDLKLALAKSLNKILQLVHDHFSSNPEAKNAVEGVKKYNNYYLRCK